MWVVWVWVRMKAILRPEFHFFGPKFNGNPKMYNSFVLISTHRLLGAGPKNVDICSETPIFWAWEEGVLFSEKKSFESMLFLTKNRKTDILVLLTKKSREREPLILVFL